MRTANGFIHNSETYGLNCPFEQIPEAILLYWWSNPQIINRNFQNVQELWDYLWKAKPNCFPTGGELFISLLNKAKENS
jgi:hypothetical protein